MAIEDGRRKYRETHRPPRRSTLNVADPAARAKLAAQADDGDTAAAALLAEHYASQGKPPGSAA